jgi:hypothetical protein
LEILLCLAFVVFHAELGVRIGVGVSHIPGWPILIITTFASVAVVTRLPLVSADLAVGKLPIRVLTIIIVVKPALLENFFNLVVKLS